MTSREPGRGCGRLTRQHGAGSVAHSRRPARIGRMTKATCQDARKSVVRRSTPARGINVPDTTYKFIAELGRELPAPAEGILSRTLCADDRLKVVGFGFAAGEELSEHTAQTPAVMHFGSGEASPTPRAAPPGHPSRPPA